MTNTSTLIDQFGRKINYLRLSVTDRCDFRCQYCMAEEMDFLPRSQVLTIEEMTTVAKVFAGLGVDKIRITGGEPLIRRDISHLFENLAELDLRDLSITTNGSRLSKFAKPLKSAGVDRINISLDTLKPQLFKQLTRTGNLQDVLEGIHAAKNEDFKAIKINTVVQKNRNMEEVFDLVNFALSNELDISFIEEMPLGYVDSHDREKEYASSESLRSKLSTQLELLPSTETTNGPSRYWQVAGSLSKIGFISPHSHNFCESCNRVRMSAEGRLLLCLGNEHSVDLREILRDSTAADTEKALSEAIVHAMAIKPENHEFDLSSEPQILRFMNATGG